jgi:AraC family L-rhamnose operon regulatory protein RhaS
MVLPPHHHLFESLARYWPLSAVDRVPLVVRIDNEGVSARDVENTHVDFHALYIVRTGRGIHVIDGVPHGVARGDVYLMANGASHCYSQQEDLSLDAIYFRPDVLDGIWPTLSKTPGFPSVPERSLRSGKWLHLTPAAYQSVRLQFEELRREWLSGTDEGALLARGLFWRVLVHLSRASVENPAGPAADRRAEREWLISEAVRFLDERYAEPIRLGDLAQRLGLSSDRLTDLFQNAMGRTPRDYLRHVRIERAKSLLATTDLPASEVGDRVGMSDPPYFSRAFLRATGETPIGYRRRVA